MIMKTSITLICLSILISGCVLPGKVAIEYNVNKNLSGKITVRFIGCTSSADDPKEAREEMEDFKLDFESDTCESFFADILGLRRRKYRYRETIRCSMLACHVSSNH